MSGEVNRIRRVRGMVLFFLLVALAIWLFLNRAHLLALPASVSAFYAKEFCSCHFVVGNNKAYCHDFADPGYPVYDVLIDSKRKRVSVSAFGFENQAQYTDRRYGCHLVGNF